MNQKGVKKDPTRRLRMQPPLKTEMSSSRYRHARPAYSSAIMACLFAATLSCLRSRAALFFARLASISSLSFSSRAFSALARWICHSNISIVVVIAWDLGEHTCSTRARLCLKVLPLLRWYSSW